MMIYLGRDPETGRIGAQTMPFVRDRDLPHGPTGDDWEHRQVDIEDWIWKNMLLGVIPYDTQDDLHHQWWDEGQETS